jgi:hypothetical protein
MIPEPHRCNTLPGGGRMRRKPRCDDSCIETKDELYANVRRMGHYSDTDIHTVVRVLRPGFSCNDEVNQAGEGMSV